MKLKKITTVTINKKKYNIRPLTLEGVMMLEDQHDITLSKMANGLSTKDLLRLLVVVLKTFNPDKEVTDDLVLKLNFTHELFSQDCLASIMGISHSDPLG